MIIQQFAHEETMVKYIIIFLLCIGIVSSAELNNSQYILTIAPVSGIINSTNGSFFLDANLGDPLIGELSNGSFKLTVGVLGPANYIPPPAEGPSSVTGGGAGCQLGSIKNEKGECIQIIEEPTNQTLISSQLIEKYQNAPIVYFLIMVAILTYAIIKLKGGKK